MISRANPLDNKSSSRDISSTRVTFPCSDSIVAAAYPSFSTRWISTSSRVIWYPPKYAMPASISSKNDSGSTASSSPRTLGRSVVHFLPRFLLFGFSCTFWNLSRSFSSSSNPTFNSSDSIPVRSPTLMPPTIHPLLHGKRCLRDDSTLILRPASARFLTNSILNSSSGSL